MFRVPFFGCPESGGGGITRFVQVCRVRLCASYPGIRGYGKEKGCRSTVQACVLRILVSTVREGKGVQEYCAGLRASYPDINGTGRKRFVQERCAGLPCPFARLRTCAYGVEIKVLVQIRRLLFCFYTNIFCQTQISTGPAVGFSDFVRNQPVVCIKNSPDAV